MTKYLHVLFLNRCHAGSLSCGCQMGALGESSSFDYEELLLMRKVIFEAIMDLLHRHTKSILGTLKKAVWTYILKWVDVAQTSKNKSLFTNWGPQCPLLWKCLLSCFYWDVLGNGQLSLVYVFLELLFFICNFLLWLVNEIQ